MENRIVKVNYIRNDMEFHSYLTNLLDEEFKTTKILTLDFSEINYINSSILELFIKNQNESNKDLRFVNLTNDVKKIFELTQLIDFFKVYNREQEIEK